MMARLMVVHNKVGVIVGMIVGFTVQIVVVVVVVVVVIEPPLLENGL